jgi:hypothetical protein
MNAGLFINRILTPRSIVKVAMATFLVALIVGRSIWMQPEMPAVSGPSWAQAISQRFYNLGSGYYESIYAKLLHSGWEQNFTNNNYNAKQNDKALQSTAMEKYKDLGSICYLKGYSDLVGKAYGLSAKIFGWSTLGFAIFFYLWLMTSVALFYFSFAGDDNALIALSLALFSMSCVNLAAPHIQQLYAFHNTRAWTVLTLIPALHIWFASLRPSTTNQLGALGQILLAFPAICVRPTAQWLLVFLFTASFANVGWRVLRDKQIPSFAEICGWSVLFVGAAFLTSLENRKEIRDPKQIYTKWHAIALGMGMSDKIQAVWREGTAPLSPPRIIREASDMDGYQLVLAYLKNAGRNQELSAYSAPGGIMRITEDFNWNKYDQQCKDAVFWLLGKSRTWDLLCLEGSKIRQFLIAFWVEGWGPSWWMGILAPLGLVYAGMISLGRFQTSKVIAPFLLILGFLFIPIFIAYPQPHGLSEGLVAYCSVVLLLFSQGLFLLAKRLGWHWKDERATNDENASSPSLGIRA